MPNSPNSKRPKPVIPEAFKRKVRAQQANDASRIFSLREELESANAALSDANIRLDLIQSEMKRLADNASIKNRAIKYAFGALWLIPTVSLGILGLVAWGGDVCIYSRCHPIRIPDVAQIALITGPFVLIVTVLGMVLRGVFQTKTEPDNLSGHIIEQIQKALGSKE